MRSDGLGGNSPKRAFGSSHAKMQSADCADCVYFPIFYHDCFVEVNVFFTTLVELIFRDNLSAMMTSIKVMKYIDNNHYQYQSFSGVLSGR